MLRLEVGKLYFYKERTYINFLEDWDTLENYVGRFISGQKKLKKEWVKGIREEDVFIENEPFLVLEEFFDKGIIDYCDGYVYRVLQNHDIGNVVMGYIKLIECNSNNFKAIKELNKFYCMFAADGG